MATNFIDVYRNAIKDVANKADGFIRALRDAAAQSANANNKGKTETKIIDKNPLPKFPEKLPKLPEKPEYYRGQHPDQDIRAPGAASYDQNTGIYTYTYKPGDNFGQVINDLGLRTDAGLWGNNGDVAYYTKQLNDQGIYGGIPAGTTIKLRHRNWNQ